MEYIEKILVSRREIPNSLEDFITAITNDIALAKSIYDTKIQEEYENKKNKDYEQQKAKALEDIEVYVNKRFKKQESKNAWREKLLNKWETNYKFFGTKYPLTAVSWKINPWDKHYNLIEYERINCFNTTYLYEQLKNNKFFKAAIGWNIVIKCTEFSFQSIGYPHIVLQLPESFQKLWNDEEDKFNKNMDKFLSTVKYHGD